MTDLSFSGSKNELKFGFRKIDKNTNLNVNLGDDIFVLRFALNEEFIFQLFNYLLHNIESYMTKEDMYTQFITLKNKLNKLGYNNMKSIQKAFILSKLDEHEMNFDHTLSLMEELIINAKDEFSNVLEDVKNNV